MSESYQGNLKNPSTIEKLTKFDLPF